MCCTCRATTARVLTDMLFGTAFLGVAIGYGIPNNSLVATSLLPTGFDLLFRGLELLHQCCGKCYDCDVCYANAFTAVAWRCLCQVPVTGVLILIYLNYGFVAEEFMAIFMTAYGAVIFLLLIITGGVVYSCNRKFNTMEVVAGTTHVTIGACFGLLIAAEWVTLSNAATQAASQTTSATTTTTTSFPATTSSGLQSSTTAFRGFFYSFNAVLSITVVPLITQTVVGITEVFCGVMHSSKSDFIVALMELCALAACFVPVGILFGPRSQDFFAVCIGVGLRLPCVIMAAVWTYSHNCWCINYGPQDDGEQVDYEVHSVDSSGRLQQMKGGFPSMPSMPSTTTVLDMGRSVESLNHRPLRATAAVSAV